MKIIISAYACDPSQGSEPACGWNWVYHTVKSGHEVWCLTKVVNKKSLLQWLDQQPIENLHFVFVPTYQWLDELSRRYHHLVVYPHYLVWQRQALQQAQALHQVHSIDMVHHATYGSLQLGSQLWKLGLPFMIGPLSGAQTVSPLLRKYLGKARFKEQLRLYISQWLLHKINSRRRLLRSASLVLAANQETHDLAKQLGSTRLRLTLDAGIGADQIPTTYQARPVRKAMRVLWLGRLVAHKGFQLVLEVFKALGEYPISLDVIGDGPLARRYRREVEESLLTKRVTFYGKLGFSALQQHYAASDVFLFCGLRNALGIQVLEAMAQGLPLISLNQHGVKTFVPDNASIKVDLLSTDQIIGDLKEALLTLYHDPSQRAQRGAHAFQWAKQHTWDHKVSDTNKLYRDLCFDQSITSMIPDSTS